MVGAPLFQKGTLRPTREDAFLPLKGLNRDKAPDSTCS